jgi:hypothetical protein
MSLQDMIHSASKVPPNALYSAPLLLPASEAENICSLGASISVRTRFVAVGQAISVIIRSLIAVLLLIGDRAGAHEWYTGRTNAAGRDCCGGRHCHAVPDGTVTEVLGGYRVVTTLDDPELGLTYSIDHVYNYTERILSPDGHWHICVVPDGGWLDGKPTLEFRCLFGPIPTY